MTVEERFKLTLGEMQFQMIVMASQLDEAKAKIAELEKNAPKKPELKQHGFQAKKP